MVMVKSFKPKIKTTIEDKRTMNNMRVIN